MPDYQARMPRYPHDLTQSTAFTSSTGMLLPVYYDFLHAGDEIHFSGNMFTRLNPIISPALCDIDIHLDYFFVPLTVMYTPSWSIFYQTDDLPSSVFAVDDFQTSGFPRFDLDSVLNNMRNTGVNNPQQKGDVVYYNEAFDSQGKAAIRLLDLLDYSYYALFTDTSANPINPTTTPWFLCAYKACYEMYFRNDDREPRDYGYNLDTYFDQGGTFASTALLRLNYASQYKDYFNSVKVSPIGSSVSMLDGATSWNLLASVESYINSYNQGYTARRSQNTAAPASKDENAVTIAFDVPNYMQSAGADRLSASGIRQLFMVDKLLRVTGRARKNYESQFLAHFGIKIPHDDLHNITHIGHDMVTLSPSTVVSSADTFDGENGSALGEMGGQGYVNLSGKKRNFKAPFHGVFMVIYHSQPRMRYYAGVSKLHDLSDPMKFWQPEYDRKGMQPIFTYEITRDTGGAGGAVRLGWQFAYEQFKRKYDRVSLAFKYASSQSSVNSYSSWVLSTSPYNLPFSRPKTVDSVTLSNFTSLLTSPKELDTIMQVRYQTTWIQNLEYGNAFTLFATDPFIHDFRLDCKKVNFMSEYGEPELD